MFHRIVRYCDIQSDICFNKNCSECDIAIAFMTFDDDKIENIFNNLDGGA